LDHCQYGVDFMLTDVAVKESGADVEWLLTPEELGSLRSTRRLFVLGLGAAVFVALGAGALTVRLASQQPRAPWDVAAPAVIFVALVAVAVWCAIRARIVGQDIRNGRAEMQWGRVTRAFRHLRVAEVEGIAFPLQMTPVPTLRAGERVRLRFAPRSRLTLQIQTFREVVAVERMAGRPVCPGVLAELGEQPPARLRPGPGEATSGSA
jgi:hypothetical protein